MDDQNQQQNMQPQGPQQIMDPQTDPSQVDQQEQAVQPQTGGGSPEAAPVQQQTEMQPQQTESGYEKIKQIEKAAEQDTNREQTPKPQQTPAPAKQEPPQKKPAKTGDQAAKPKYFGYQPPPSISNNAGYVKKNAGKGNVKDSKTWLLLFLDRLLKKESD
ncbi:hypothetical protein JW978_04525 [Candidatus Dojkabacteria bacterium]|nr:hypothetical protein [Candidatus Dojkabacteria bacterium]